MLTAVKDKSSRINSVAKGVSYADLHSEAGILRLQAVSENIIRIRFTAEDGFKDSDKPGLLPLEPFENFEYTESDTQIIFKTAAIRAEVDRNSAAISFYDPSGRLLLKERSKDPRSLEAFDAFRLVLRHAVSTQIAVPEITSGIGVSESRRDAEHSDGFLLVLLIAVIDKLFSQ